MKKVLLILIFFISTNEAFACSCIDRNESLKKKVKREFVSSSTIFTGEVIKIEESRSHKKYLFSGDIITYTFKINKIIKGKTTSKIVKVKSNRSSISCGYVFELDKTYLVYSDFYKGSKKKHISSKDLFASICNRNNLLKYVKEKEIKLLENFSKKNYSSSK